MKAAQSGYTMRKKYRKEYKDRHHQNDSQENGIHKAKL